MTEYNEIFELVLYFDRRAVSKPNKPSFEDIRNSNPALNYDDLLDIYSEFKNKYKSDMIRYEKIKNDAIVPDFVRISADEEFMEKIKKFEKNNFFIKWDECSQKLINETFMKLTK
jgi:hypothetical protein